MTGQTSFWMERVYARLGMSFALGAVLVGFLPFLLALVGAYLALSLEQFFVRDLILGVPFYFLQSMQAQFGARQAANRIRALSNYAQSLDSDNAPIPLRPLYGLRGVLVAWAAISGIIIPVFFFAVLGELTTLQALLTTVFPWLYYSFIVGTFLWVWGYSMVSVYRMGKLPLRLKPFTEDPALGLRPFAATSLRLTGLYLAFVALFTIPTVVQGFVSLPFVALFAGLFLLGFAIFLLPLVGLHRKLVETKRLELGWVGARYSRLVQQLRENRDGPLHQDLATELTAVKEVQRDIQQIRTWPFDTGILVRLTAIILTVTAILLSRIIQTTLGF